MSNFFKLNAFMALTKTKVSVIFIILLAIFYAIYYIFDIKINNTAGSLNDTQAKSTQPSSNESSHKQDEKKADSVQLSKVKEETVEHSDSDTARFIIDCMKINAEIARVESALDQTNSRTLPIFLAKSEKDLDDLSKKLISIRSKKEYCNNIDRSQFLETAGKILRESASKGDVESQLCVIEQKLLSARANGLSDDEKINRETYLTNYRTDACRRGDLRIVQLDAESSLTVGHGPIGSHMTSFPIDKATYYRSLLLLRKAAIGDYANELDNSIIQFKKSINSQGDEHTSFSDGELQEQEHSADEIFDSYFVNSAKLQSPPVPCGQ